MYHYKVDQINRIIDGDTVEVTLDLGFSIYNRLRIRLADIDTPEIRTKDLEEKKRGHEAAQRLRDLMYEAFDNDTLTMTSEKLDKYGRYLGTFYTNKPNSINQILVLEDLAKPYDGGKK
jgi:micrococcal nuclease